MTSGFDVTEWASRLAWKAIPVESPDVIGIGDFEIAYFVSAHHGIVTVDRSSRGARRTLASFRTTDDAIKFLTMTLGAAWRSSSGLPSLTQGELSIHATLDEGPTAVHLEWTGGSADFANGYTGRRNAREFSHIVHANTADIAVSFESIDGAPLFA